MLRRADSPMMAREIAAEFAARYQIDASNTDAMNALVAKVRNTSRDRGGSRAKCGAMRRHDGSKPEEGSTSLSSVPLPSPSLGLNAPPIGAGEEDSDDSGYRRKLHYQPLKRAVAKVGINAEDDLDPFRPQRRSKEE